MTADIEKKERISWIDTAKGFLMFCIILGHTSTGVLHNMIYSFHIPLFVFLSGVTVPNEADKLSFAKIKKLFLRLFLPVIVVLLIESLISTFIGGNFINNLRSKFIGEFISELIFANGVMWFLVVLFWSKIIYQIILLYHLDKMVFILPILFLCLIFEQKIGRAGKIIQIPQKFDMIPIFMFFMHLGHLYKGHREKIDRYAGILSFTSFFISIFLINEHYYFFDIALRWWFRPIVCIIAALSSGYFMLNFIITLDGFKLPASFFSFVGRHSLFLLCLHALEIKLFDKIYFYPCYMTGGKTMIAAGVFRCLLDIILMSSVLYLVKLFRNKTR